MKLWVCGYFEDALAPSTEKLFRSAELREFLGKFS